MEDGRGALAAPSQATGRSGAPERPEGALQVDSPIIGVGPRFRRRRRRPTATGIGIVVSLVGVLTWPGISLASGGPLVVVSWPGAERSAWLDADGVPGRRFVDLCRRDGWIFRADELTAGEQRALDGWGATLGEVLFCLGPEGSGARLLPVGSGDAALALRWEGAWPEGDPQDLLRESQVWLTGHGRIRWEEVVEILDLTTQENRAFQLLGDSEHPFRRLCGAYLRDKAGANLAVYLLGTRPLRALHWRLSLVETFEMNVIPQVIRVLEPRADVGGVRPEEIWATGPLVAPGPVTRADAGGIQGGPGTWFDPVRLDHARRRLFARRILGSRGRIYGRCDRILLSAMAEGPDGMTLVVDARESKDPFVAVCRTDPPLPPPGGRGTLLEERLSR